MNKDEIVKIMLENQKSMVDEKDRLAKLMSDIEPFSWMDDQVRACLLSKLSDKEMNDLDRCARANIAGQKIMANVLTNVFKHA